MRIALLLSGQIRQTSNCFESIRTKFIQNLGCDVFVSSWTPGGNFTHFIRHDSRTDSYSYDLKDVFSYLNPKSILLEDFESPSIQSLITKAWELDLHGPMNGESHPVGIVCMWYKIQSAFRLMENFEQNLGHKYDYVVKGRFDVDVLDEINIEANPNYVMIPAGYDWRGGFSDIFAWGQREPMGHYCNLYDNLDKYVYEEKVFFHPETLLKHHLINSSYGVKRPAIKMSLRGKNLWEYENYPENHKLLNE
jgi:hypothetical protein